MKSMGFSEVDITVKEINNILFRKYEPGWEFCFEKRPSCALYYIISGELTIALPSGELCLGAGDVGIFDADAPMLLKNRGSAVLESYQISFFADRNLSSLGLPTVMRGVSELCSRFAASYELYIAHGIGYRIRARAAIYELIEALLIKQAEGRQGRACAKLSSVVAYIGEHYASPLSLSTLSRSVGYSPSYLRELFRAAMTPLKSRPNRCVRF